MVLTSGAFSLTLTVFSAVVMFVDRGSTQSLTQASCKPGMFLKNFYCVSACGPGFYGNSNTRKCEKCASSCRTCLDGDLPTKCSSCNWPLYIQGTTCVKSCGQQRSKGPPYRQIRLVEVGTHFEGRVEIFHDNKWGTICDDSWDINDAKVVCRELLLGDAREAVTFGRLGSGPNEQPIWLSQVNCTGNETRLENCDHPAWGEHSCGHFEDAGVRCMGPDTTRECVDECGEGYFKVKGRQECGVCMASCLTCSNSASNCISCDKPRFLRDNTCRTYCGDGYYGDPTDRKCKVCDPACRTCADGTSPSSCTSCHDDRYLNGTQCVKSCDPRHVAQKRHLRLAGNRPTDLEGRVEVYRSGAWVTVCDQTFDFREASVVCRELGMGAAVKAVKRAAYGRGYGRVWTDILNCTGREGSIHDCPLVKRSFSSLCYHGNDVGVVCAGPVTRQLTNRCVKQCDAGWFKNDMDVCQTCSDACLECMGTSSRCIKCMAPKFLKDNTCVDKCAADEYGYIPKRECRKCNTNICVTCSDGSGDSNCTSCKEPKALMNGKCADNCGPTMYRKKGRCVKDCGISMYKFPGNFSCLPCPSECITCEFKSGKPVCTICNPPLVRDEQSETCVVNCTAGKYAVPHTNFTLQTAPNLRLSNGVDYLEGLLEVYHDGVWGTVCDDGWDFAETNVVCRELHLGKADTHASLRHIPKGTGKMWLDDLFCSGSEKSLFDCRHRPWGHSNCQHNEDTVLRCTGPGVRTCKDKCPDGFFAKGNTCQQCNTTCGTCQGSANKCITCASGFHQKNDSCVKDCGIGYFLDKDKICKPCYARCADCEVTADNCTSCSPPLFRNGTSCVANCTSGFKPSSRPLVRLVNGKTPLEGRVEVLHEGEYGTVCDDGWDLLDANVVCNMLNMGNATRAAIRAEFGSGAKRIWLDEVQCFGNESSLVACQHMGWGRENCDHTEDAGVVCQGPDKSRDCLANCSSGYFISPVDQSCGRCSPNCKECRGSPENCSLCDEGKFLNTTGNISSCVTDCKKGQFGDPDTKQCRNCSKGCSDCFGKPSNCTECKQGTYLLEDKVNSCVEKCPLRANKIVSGVRDIKLVGSNSSREGRVELMYKGEWGTICDDSFDMNEAKVICRQLKLGTAVAAYSSARYGQGTGKIWMDDTQCTGNERRLQDCRFHHGGFGNNNCGHSEDAGVKCSGPDLSTRCVSDCGDGFYDDKDTCKRCQDTCKTCLGKPDRCASCNPPYFLEFTSCVQECPLGKHGNTINRKCEPCDKQCQTCFNGEKNNLCKSCREGLFLRGLKCVTDCGPDMMPVSSLFPPKPSKPLVRLVDGKSKQEGRVEVFYGGEWGTVCDDDWDLKEATIVCKELGFGRAKEAPKHSKFGKGDGIIWMDNVNCYGYETSLTQCRQVGWGQGNCDPLHREDAGVVCDNTTVEEISNNYCRRVNNGSCDDLKECDTFNRVTCVNLDVFNEAFNAGNSRQESVCLQCPDGTAGDGKECRAVATKPPEFDRTPSSKTVKAQDVITLQCRSKPPRIFPTLWDWRKDGKPLLEADINNNRITLSAGQLLIKSATREDSGKYTCTLVNTAGNITSNSSEVIVKEPPRILGVLSADVSRDGIANLSCIVSCYPPSNITWKFNGKNLTRSAKYEFIDSTYTIKVKNVQFEDAGLYECSVINELGEARANASLTVGLTVEFKDYPIKTIATKGDLVTFNCNVTGVPKPRIAWKKDGELVTNDNWHTVTTNRASRKDSTASQLQIRQVNKGDIAEYSCIAWNRGSVREVLR
ncbi:hypothetical protein ACROYT_G000235 [Oculina patagonica]